MTDCAYCGCDVHAHDPVFVSEGSPGDGSDVAGFCNYACLVAHVEAAGLTTGATCRLDG